VRNDVLELAASVPARRASSVTPGQEVRFTADGRAFDGRVARVSPTIDPTTRSITVYVQVPNPGGALKGGAFAAGRIVGSTRRGVIVIPTAALRQGAAEGERFVYRIEGQVLAQAPVRLGIVDEGRGIAEVEEGLREGDRIVVGNVGTLGVGMQVEIIGDEEAGRGGRGPGTGGRGAGTPSAPPRPDAPVGPPPRSQ
jgi:RND family efflux transporter MFP subunit